jgi:hypothetical protein
VQSVHSHGRVGSAVVGYVSTHKNVSVQKARGDWMLVSLK